MKLVEKYGGTSLGSIEKIKAVALRISSGYPDRLPAVVVSAMAGETNRLLQLIGEMNPKASKVHTDMALTAGEQVSVALLCAALEATGLKAQGFLAYQLGIRAIGQHGRARIKEIDVGQIFNCWNKGIIPVIAGFQGVSPEDQLMTLGRGGSDTSAVALSAALGSELCEINTDVAGVFTCDPRIVPGARLIPKLDYECAYEMAALGSKVLHPRSVEVAAKYGIPLLVRESLSEAEESGTMISRFSETEVLEAPVVSAITLSRNVLKVGVTSLKTDKQYFASLFSYISACEINVDIIVFNHLEDRSLRVGFTVENEDRELIESALNRWRQDNGIEMEFQIDGSLAKISTVGVGMKSHHGVASSMFEELELAKIPIHMISTSEIKISCVIPDHEGDRACKLLHDRFIDN